MKKSIPFILLFLLLSAALAFVAVKTTGNVISQEITCAETDDGPYEKIPGKVTYETIFGTTRTLVDTCRKGIAREHTCNGKRASSKTVVCDNSCNAEGTACENTEWEISDAEIDDNTTNEVAFDEAFENAEPGDELIFLVANEGTDNAEPFILNVEPPYSLSNKEKYSPPEFCKFFVFKNPSIRTVHETGNEILKSPEKNATSLMTTNSDKTQDNVWGADSGCFYKTTIRLEKPDALTLGTTLQDKILPMQRMYNRYCTGQIGDVPVTLSICKIADQKGWEEVLIGIGGLLKITISLDGKKK